MKNPGNSAERYALSGAVVTRCDGSGATISYQDTAINEKGVPTKDGK